MLSQALAAEHHLHIGERVTLPTPVPDDCQRRGALDEHRLGAGRDHHERGRLRARVGQHGRERVQRPARPGRERRRGGARDQRARSAPSSGLSVQSAQAHADEQNALSRQGLQRLTQIATLILVVAVLAMAAAIGNMVWQRRPRLAKLKLEGFPRAELWRTILLESVLLLAVGCLTGARLASTASSCWTARWRT